MRNNIDKVSGKHLDYYEVAKELISEYHIITFRGTTYIYKDGWYREENGLINRRIMQILLECGLKAKESVTTPTTQIKHIVAALTTEEEYPFNKQPSLIPVRNGVIKFDNQGNVELVLHSPDYRFTYQLPINFNPSADTKPVLEYLDSTGCDKDILLQIPAQALLSKGGRCYKKAYLLKGEKNSGKTTFLNLVNLRFFGEENCSNIPLHSLINENHSSAGLVGKLVNICDELPKIKLEDVGFFKSMTGGGMITVNRKYHDPYSYKCDTTFIFAANDYPPVSQDDNAFWERWILIEFNNAHAVDPAFEARSFTDEFMSGFLNLVIERMKVIFKEEIKSDPYTVTRGKWLNGSDPFYRYVSTQLQRDSNCYEQTDYLYKDCVAFYKSQGLVPLSPKEFGSKMKAICLCKQRTLDGKKKRYYIGIRIKSSQHEAIQIVT